MTSKIAYAGRGRLARSLVMPATGQVAAAAMMVVAAYATLEFAWPNHGFANVVDIVIFPALGLVYVPLAFLVATKARGRLRTAWWAVAIGLTSWAVGEAILAYYALKGGEVPFPSEADVAYLLYVPCIAFGLVLFPSARNWRDQSRMILDGLIVAGSFFLISWLWVMRGVWRNEATSSVNFAVALAYPISDVLIVTLGFLVLMRAPARLRTPFALLVVGLACAAVADSVWVYLTNSSHNGTTVPHILYLANALLIIVALVSAYHAEPFTAALADPPSRLTLWLPIVPLVGVAVSVAASSTDVVTEAPVVVGGAFLITATLVRQFLESSELVRRENEVRRLADRLTDELDSASQYVASILPGPLDGPVQVSSRYRPARAVGGDSYDYQWVDDDHLIAYLIDVSGHGVRPALVSVSVHNHLRSGGLSAEVLLAPKRVLTELNSRFGMDNQDDHYFTMWFGVYQLSTGVLRYANAGHPPPLVLMGDGKSFPLTGAELPVGMFPDSEFTEETFAVPAGARILLYSDGVLGSPVQAATFVALCEELAGGSSFWLDDLIDDAPVSDDDCSLVLLSFPVSATNGSVQVSGSRRT